MISLRTQQHPDTLTYLLSIDTESLRREASLKLLGKFQERARTPPLSEQPDPFKPKKHVAVEDVPKVRRKSRRRSTINYTLTFGKAKPKVEIKN